MNDNNKPASAMITFIGGKDDGGAAFNEWPYGTYGQGQVYRFERNKPLEVTDPHIIAKAKTNPMFKVEEGGAKPAAKEPAKDDDDDDDKGGVRRKSRL